MTWPQLIRSKDAAWREFCRATLPFFKPNYRLAALENYLWWQQLVDNYSGDK
jgi:hypothetical protein